MNEWMNSFITFVGMSHICLKLDRKWRILSVTMRVSTCVSTVNRWTFIGRKIFSNIGPLCGQKRKTFLWAIHFVLNFASLEIIRHKLVYVFWRKQTKHTRHGNVTLCLCSLTVYLFILFLWTGTLISGKCLRILLVPPLTFPDSLLFTSL